MIAYINENLLHDTVYSDIIFSEIRNLCRLMIKFKMTIMTLRLCVYTMDVKKAHIRLKTLFSIKETSLMLSSVCFIIHRFLKGFTKELTLYIDCLVIFNNISISILIQSNPDTDTSI